jgi:hypothetical protein
MTTSSLSSRPARLRGDGRKPRERTQVVSSPVGRTSAVDLVKSLMTRTDARFRLNSPLGRALATVLVATSALGGSCGQSSAQNADGASQLGASCVSNQNCASPGFFCERPNGVCGATYGTCASTFPVDDCTAGPAVCGCDGQTYQGECVRQQHAVSEDHEGPCAEM